MAYLLSIDSVRENFKLNACKGERQIVEHSTVYHWDRHGDDRLISQDVSGWWVVRDVFGRSTWITT